MSYKLFESTLVWPTAAGDSHPAGASRRHDFQLPLAVCCKRKTGTDVIFCQIGEIVKHLGMAHPRCKIFKHVGNGDAEVAYTGLPIALSRLNRDDIRVLHASKRNQKAPGAQIETVAIFEWFNNRNQK